MRKTLKIKIDVLSIKKGQYFSTIG